MTESIRPILNWLQTPMINIHHLQIRLRVHRNIII